jgi:large subunit ribosomal protein L18
MIKRLSRAELRKKRRLRLRKKVLGTDDRPRVCVFRSGANLYLHLIDDGRGRVLCTLSTLSPEFKEKKLSSSKNMAAAKALAEMFAEKLKQNNVTEAVFDRSGYRYHGKIKVMAEALRENGLIA